MFLCTTLVVGGDLVDPPFAFMKKRKEVGFEVDLVREIAKKLDREVRFVKKEEACDLKLGGCESRFSYMTSPLSLLVDTSRHPETTSWKDVNGRIGVQGFGKEIAEKMGEVVVYRDDRTIDAIVDLMQGRIDAFLKLKPAAIYLKFSAPSLKIVGEVPQSGVQIGFGIEDEELGAAVAIAQKELVEEGTFEVIYHKWFGYNWN
ncbi:MAG: L-cystine-binding protein FliY [Chlamydiales bacterium]|nr:L-cystine-binding protein FliY [Chlamydiales bacterium]MCH9622802.1 L-cystine-binding protein FliY [Chlamydiales bacterium]